jgi:hypothetical protein
MPPWLRQTYHSDTRIIVPSLATYLASKYHVVAVIRLIAKSLASYLPVNKLTLEHLSYLKLHCQLSYLSTYQVSITNYTQPKP